MTRRLQIVLIVICACFAMSLVDAVIQPGYIIKSAIKVALFIILPILYIVLNGEKSVVNILKPYKKGLILAIFLGLCVYSVVLGAYFIFRNIFDFSALTTSLTTTTGVNKYNFAFVALYISLINSLLEELFFRGFAFITLKKYSTRRAAYIFSSALFSLYHISMMIGWFGLPVLMLSVLGLFVGGVIFNYFDEKSGTIYLSWLIHMFANFATNTIGFILFAQ